MTEEAFEAGKQLRKTITSYKQILKNIGNTVNPEIGVRTDNRTLWFNIDDQERGWLYKAL